MIQIKLNSKQESRCGISLTVHKIIKMCNEIKQNLNKINNNTIIKQCNATLITSCDEWDSKIMRW